MFQNLEHSWKGGLILIVLGHKYFNGSFDSRKGVQKMVINFNPIQDQNIPTISIGHADGENPDEINVCLDGKNLEKNLNITIDISDIEDDLLNTLLMRKIQNFSREIEKNEILISLIENYCPMTVDALLEKSFAKTDYLNLDKILEQNFIETVEEAKAA